MDIFNDDLLAFWKALNSFQVKYIMVDGVATNFNGYQRTTDDIDVWIEDTIENHSKSDLPLKNIQGKIFL